MKAKARTNIDINALLSSGRNRYSFKAEAQEATINVFGEIDDWWGFGVREMALNLSENKAKKLNINIHSPGGSVTEGIGIANLIKSHTAETTTTGVGFVASIASVILLAGDNVRMAENAFLMIHNPWSIAMGDSEELRKTADVLDKMENELASVYVQAIQARGKDTSIEEIKSLMQAETWFTADEAKSMGFIDEVAGRVEIADTEAGAKEQVEVLAKFKNIPQALADDLNKFSNTNNDKNMAKTDKSLFAKLGELFATAAEETEAPEVVETPPPAEEEQPDATMSIEEMREILEREGYTVAQQKEEILEEAQPEEEEENAELVAIREEMKALKAEMKRKAGTPSGGADSKEETGNRIPSNAKPFFDNLAQVIKTHRPN